MLECLVLLLNVSFEMVVISMTSRITKLTVDKYKCSNLGGIILLIVVGKLYGRVMIQRVKAVLECATGQEQCGFRLGRKCVD